MSKGSRFLTYVTEKLKDRIKELCGTIKDVEKDIESMNEYYWQNYTEMDQYGYENYDNQQALLAQVNANQDNRQTLKRYKKMLDSPFFGSVEFLYDGEEAAENFYIGIGNFSEKQGSIPLIYDWRAPVGGLFYDYDKGRASYEAPAGMLEGEILSKWQYKIRGGHMLYEFESDMKIDDEILKEELGTNSDTRLKNIVRTIQREQNRIIRNTKDRIMVIQGVAGSGKTSVALHRIAYLLYHDRAHLKSRNILVLSPNSVFADYISHILPELGEENIQEMSLDLFAYRELSAAAADCEDRFHQIERQLGNAGKSGAGESREDERRYRWKQSEEFVRAAEGFFVELEDRLVDFRDVSFGNFRKKEEELMKLFYDRFGSISLLSRMDAVMEYFIDEYETLMGRNLDEDERENIKSQFSSMYVTEDIYVIYSWFLEENGFPALKEAPLDERYLRYEDVYPLLYFKCRLYKGGARKDIRHLVIDEMQDYTYLQYVLLERLFPCSMTILGDRAQTIDVREQDVSAFLPEIFGKGIRLIKMEKSYRNTLEIAEYAGKLIEAENAGYLKRHGKEVTEAHYGTMEEALEAVLLEAGADASGYPYPGTDARGGLSPSGFETAAVLTMTEPEARRAYAYLKERCRNISYIDRDSRNFRKGITVTAYYMAKGLEFDQVFVLGGDKEHAMFRNFRYISATRALHELYVYDTADKG